MGNDIIIKAQTDNALHFEAIRRLLGQLTSRPIEFTMSTYNAIVLDSHTQLWLMQCEGVVVGMVALGLYLTPTGTKAWIEDVVVDEHYRGRGLGRRLLSYAIEQSKICGADTLMLTSKPARVTANALYRSLGFKNKETNVYCMQLR